jgi:hypothetical protein
VVFITSRPAGQPAGQPLACIARAAVRTANLSRKIQIIFTEITNSCRKYFVISCLPSSWARAQLNGTADSRAMRTIKYRQQNLFETDEMCVIKAAANAIDIFDPSAAEKAMTSAGTGLLKMNQVKAILRAGGVRTAAVKEEDPNFLLTAPGGVYLTQLIDGNGCKGHAVAVDVDRKVIIDPVEKYELPLSLRNLDKCCGLASMCCGLYLLQKLDMPAAATEASSMDVEAEDDGAGVFPKGTAAEQPARGTRGAAHGRKKAKQAKKRRVSAAES